MTDQRPAPHEEAKQSRAEGFRFLFCILGFFIVVACVDAFFVYKAVSTYNGTVVENPYEVGLHYNEVIAEARKREAQNGSGGN